MKLNRTYLQLLVSVLSCEDLLISFFSICLLLTLCKLGTELFKINLPKIII